jgi:hypothetical protein
MCPRTHTRTPDTDDDPLAALESVLQYKPVSAELLLGELVGAGASVETVCVCDFAIQCSVAVCYSSVCYW